MRRAARFRILAGVSLDGDGDPVPGRLLRWLDQARADRRDRDEQEGRGGDGRAPARGRPYGPALQHERSAGSGTFAAAERGADVVAYGGWEAIDTLERAAESRTGARGSNSLPGTSCLRGARSLGRGVNRELPTPIVQTCGSNVCPAVPGVSLASSVAPTPASVRAVATSAGRDRRRSRSSARPAVSALLKLRIA